MFVSVRRGLIAGTYLLVLSVLYLLPLGFYSPCVKEKGTLGPPPALIGHRGAPMVRHAAMSMVTLSVWRICLSFKSAKRVAKLVRS